MENIGKERLWDAARFTSIIPRLHEYDCVMFGGYVGEALVNPHLPQMLKELKAANKRIEVNILTNGLALVPAVVDPLIPYVDVFSISMAAATAATHGALVRHSDFFKIMSNLKWISQLQPRNFTLHINYIGMRCNIHEFPELVKLAKVLGIGVVYLRSFSEEGEPSIHGQSLVREPVLLRKYWNIAQTVAGTLGVHIDTSEAYRVVVEDLGQAGVEHYIAKSREPEPEDAMHYPTPQLPNDCQTRDCIMPFYAAIVTHDGWVIPCCSWTFTERKVINLFDATSVPIGRTPFYVRYRKALLTGKLPACCKYCNRAAVIETDKFVHKMTVAYNRGRLQSTMLMRNVIKYGGRLDRQGAERA